MMRSRFAVLVLLAACRVAPAGAQPCDGTPVTSVDPHFEPAVTGTVCRLDRGTAYVAGTALTLVDVNIWDQPIVTGSVPLPAAALDIAVVWPRAYVACGDAGVVEVDVRDMAAPVITRAYDPAGVVSNVVAVNGAIVALDDADDVHLLATANDGPLVAMAVRRWAEATRLAEARGYLVIDDREKLSTVRSFSSVGFDIAGAIGHADSPHSSAMAASGDMIVFLEIWQQLGAYAEGQTESITSFQVSPQGTLSRLATRSNLPGDWQSVVVAAAGGWFLQARDNPLPNDYPPEAKLRRAGDLSIQATLPLGGTSISTNGRVVVAVGRGGLVTLSLEPVLQRQKPRDVVGNGEMRLGPSFDWTLRSAQWRGRFGLLTSTKFFYAGGAYGGSSVAMDYTLVCGDGPDTWTTITSGRASQRSPRMEDYYTYGSASLRLAGAKGNRAVLVLDGVPTLGITVVDGRSGSVIYQDGQPYANEYGNNVRSGYADGLLWFADDTTVRCLDIEAALPLAPVDVTADVPATIAPGALMPADRNLLVVRNGTTGAYDAYDTSDLTDIHPLGSLVLPPQFWPTRTAWLGRRLVLDGSTSLLVADFADPAAPVIRSQTALPFSPTGMTVAGDRVVLRCDEERRAPIRLSCRFLVADLAPDGAVTLHAPWNAGSTTDVATSLSSVLSGNILYADLGYAVRAYDLTDPEHPAAVGDTRNGSGMTTIFGDYLASGSLLTPRHCRDLPPVRNVVAEVLQVLKPGAANGGAPALIEIAVRPSPGFDPAQINPATVRFGPGAAAPVAAPVAASAPLLRRTGRPSDGNAVAAEPALFWFRLDDAGIAAAAATAELNGRTWGGERLRGVVGLGIPLPEPDTQRETALAATPNPFNPQTSLRFTLPQAGSCTLEIFDLQGRRVRVLIGGTILAAGEHAITWDGRDGTGSAVASGVYFARLAGLKGSWTQRLALVR
ncbi:MAG: T9SS type A sorting domain-containing protein [bacterium]|nr:T9SS type A sorting domain-containing protein [bacterium]